MLLVNADQSRGAIAVNYRRCFFFSFIINGWSWAALFKCQSRSEMAAEFVICWTPSQYRNSLEVEHRAGIPAIHILDWT